MIQLSGKRLDQNGFTLIEVLMVIAILGIIASVAAATGLKSGPDMASLSAQADKLVSDLRLMQNKASACQSKVFFSLLSDGSGYQYQMGSLSETFKLDRGVKISASPVSFSFNTDGTRSGSGDYEINLTVDDKMETIVVSQMGLIQLKN